jgi:hypothetical protein
MCAKTKMDRDQILDDAPKVYINQTKPIMELFSWEKVSSEVATPIRAPDGSYVTILTPRFHYKFTQYVSNRFNQPPTQTGGSGTRNHIVVDADSIAVFEVPRKRVVNFAGSSGNDITLAANDFQKGARKWSTASSSIARDSSGVYTQQHILTASTRLILETTKQRKYTIPKLANISEGPEFT